MRSLFGIGTPRALQGLAGSLVMLLSTSWRFVHEAIDPFRDRHVSGADVRALAD